MVFNRRPCEAEMTIVIVGVPRGGTTMVAAVVDSLGIDLGPREELNKFHFEDQTMNQPHPKQRHEYITKRNSEHPIWGWKDPIGIVPLQEMIFALRNPRVIVVSRDTLASIQGEMRFDKVNEVAHPKTLPDLVEQTMQWQEQNWKFVLRTTVPTLLVSYERALVDRKLFLHELSGFLGMNLRPEQLNTAMDCISPTGGYIQP